MDVGIASERGSEAGLVAALVLLCAASPGTAGIAHAAHPPGTLAKARAALAAGRIDDALKLAREALARSRSVATLHVAGMCAFRAAKFDEAREAFAAELADQPAASDAARAAAFNLAGAELKVGRYAEARGHYLAAAALDRLAPLATLYAAVAADAAGDGGAALELLRKAAALGAALGQGAVTDEARTRIADLVEAQADATRREARALVKQGMLLLRAGKAADAVALLTQALDRARTGRMGDAERADIDYTLGHALLDAARGDEAIAAFRRAAETTPGDAEYRYMLGLALYRTGAFAESAVEFKAAVDHGLPEADAARARDFLATIARSGAR